MNIARWFAAYRIIEAELERERREHAATRRAAQEDRQRLTDAFARARGASTVYAPLPPPEHPLLGKPAVGPTMTAARAHAERSNQERHKRQPTDAEIEEAVRIALALDEESEPAPKANGDAEWPEPIAPDKIL